MGPARVLRIRWCSACDTLDWAYYRPESLSLADRVQHFCERCCRPCEFLDHWPNRHGECRALAVPELRSVNAERRVDAAAGDRGSWREALGPAQQELKL